MEPNILAFCCYWCSYTSADLAGVNRSTYPSNVRIQRYRCTGQIPPDHVLRAFEYGADGVIVTGCRLGDCHYVSGNYKERRRMVVIKTILDTLGLESDRVWLRWIAASDVPKFAATINEVTEEVKKLGPNPIGNAWSV